jgi:hypothetical protein
MSREGVVIMLAVISLTAVLWATRRLARARVGLGIVVAAAAFTGCATMKESDTARTGIEQLLISTAVDRSLNRVDLRPIAKAKVFLDTQYLDCVDKNYIIVAMHQRLMQNGCTLVGKAEDAQVVVEVASGGVGTDRNELFVGVPSIPLPPPSPISIPKLPVFDRTKAMGTAKLAIVAYDATTKQPVINSGYSIARADHRNTNVLGIGGLQTGSVHRELVAATGEAESLADLPAVARQQKAVTATGTTTIR